MKRVSLLLVVSFLMTFSCKNADGPAQQLRGRLAELASSGTVAYGHQDDLAYGHSWKVENWETDNLDRSDVKAVTGKYPMVMGFDLGGIELADSCNLDGVPFGLIHKASMTHDLRGGMVTYSWHPRNPLTGGDAWDVSSAQVVSSILEGGALHDEFMLWLDRAASFFESLGGIPVIFRPWHENVGSWFWWGGNLCTADEYKSLFRLTRDYFESRGIRNVRWCYSPNGNCTPEEYRERYPGDDYVDIVGIDSYEYVGDGSLEEAALRYRNELTQALDFLTAFGKEHGKEICLSETGLEGLPDSKWWTETLYPVIKNYPLLYVLTWRNAHDKTGHFYAPWKGFDGAEDFKAFSELENIQFLDTLYCTK